MSISADLGPGSRATALDAMEAGELDVLVVGGGVVGAGAALDAVTRGLTVGAARAARPRQRHVVAVEQARARRPALPGDVRLRAGPRGAGGARPAAHPARARTWCGRCRSSTRCTTRWERPYVGAGLALYDALAMAGQVRHGRAPAPAPVPQAGRPDRARPAHRRAHRRDPLLRLPGRRRPAGDDRRPHRRRRTAPTSRPAPGSPASCARASGSSASARADLETGRELEVRARVVVNAAGVWTDEIQELRRRPRCAATSRPARASTSSCRATGSAPSAASSPRPRSRCCS